MQTISSLIGGKAKLGSGTSPVLNPHDSSLIAMLTLAKQADVDVAVRSARAGHEVWRAVPAVRRGEILFKACALMEARSDELSQIVAREAGKPPRDARAETAGAIQCGRFFAAEGQRLFGRTMPSATVGKYAMTVRQPCGVAALITASNTPAPNFAWKVFPALICGNGIVLKPSEDTPVSADWLARILIEAGVPSEALNVLQGIGADIGPALVDHDGVDVISFTGSTAVGRDIAMRAGAKLKKVSLELGGKNAFVVCADADLDNAARWAALSAFSNAGQRCASGSRFLVDAAVYDDFANRFVERATALSLGVSETSDVGPLINGRQLDRALSAIDAALTRGARALCGGRRAGGALKSGFYLEPTIISDLAEDDRLHEAELFSPVAQLYRTSGLTHAIEKVNTSSYGLTACIHTRSLDRAWRFAHEVETGVAVVNGGTYGSEPHMPFGGRKASGNGTREPGTEALDIYTELKDLYFFVDAEAQ